MDIEGFDMEMEIAPNDAAKALAVPPRTVNNWLRDGVLAGQQGITGRWRVSVGSLFALIETRGFAGKPYEEEVRARLINDIMPRYEKSGAKASRKNVLTRAYN